MECSLEKRRARAEGESTEGRLVAASFDLAADGGDELGPSVGAAGAGNLSAEQQGGRVPLHARHLFLWPLQRRRKAEGGQKEGRGGGR